MNYHFRHWMTHPDIRNLTLAARGLLADLIQIATAPDEQQPGALTEFDLPLYDDEIARKTGINIRTLPKLFRELTKARLLRKTKNNLYYLPTVVRMARAAERKREDGKKGGNPALVKIKKPVKTGIQLYANRRTPYAAAEHRMFGQFWHHYPVRKNQNPTRAAFHMQRFPDQPAEFVRMINHLKDRIDPVVGDIKWLEHPETIPEPTVFIKKQLWKQDYRSSLEVRG